MNNRHRGQAGPYSAARKWIISLVPGPQPTFRVTTSVLNLGPATRYNNDAELPAVYVNAEQSLLAWYGGDQPWQPGGTLQRQAITPVSTTRYNPEQWFALVDRQDVGLGVYTPGGYSQVMGARAFPGDGTTGPNGDYTHYAVQRIPTTVLPYGRLVVDTYLMPGAVESIRRTVQQLHATLPAIDIATPLANIDTPAAGTVLGGRAALFSGWALDNVAVSSVELLIDGVTTARTTPAIPRPDVVQSLGGGLPVNSGWSTAVDLTGVPNGPRQLQLRVTDGAGNVAVTAPRTITVDNSADRDPPLLFLDAPAPSAELSGQVTVRGWALDANELDTVVVLVDGQAVTSGRPTLARPDVLAAYPWASGTPGYAYTLDTRLFPNGEHTLAVQAQDRAGLKTRIERVVRFRNP